MIFKICLVTSVTLHLGYKTKKQFLNSSKHWGFQLQLSGPCVFHFLFSTFETYLFLRICGDSGLVLRQVDWQKPGQVGWRGPVIGGQVDLRLQVAKLSCRKVAFGWYWCATPHCWTFWWWTDCSASTMVCSGWEVCQILWFQFLLSPCNLRLTCTSENIFKSCFPRQHLNSRCLSMWMWQIPWEPRMKMRE